MKVRKLSYFGHTDDSKEIGYRDTERGDLRRTLRITEQERNFKLFGASRCRKGLVNPF